MGTRRTKTAILIFSGTGKANIIKKKRTFTEQRNTLKILLGTREHGGPLEWVKQLVCPSFPTEVSAVQYRPFNRLSSRKIQPGSVTFNVIWQFESRLTLAWPAACSIYLSRISNTNKVKITLLLTSVPVLSGN